MKNKFGLWLVAIIAIAAIVVMVGIGTSQSGDATRRDTGTDSPENGQKPVSRETAIEMLRQDLSKEDFDIVYKHLQDGGELICEDSDGGDQIRTPGTVSQWFGNRLGTPDRSPDFCRGVDIDERICYTYVTFNEQGDGELHSFAVSAGTAANFGYYSRYGEGTVLSDGSIRCPPNTACMRAPSGEGYCG